MYRLETGKVSEESIYYLCGYIALYYNTGHKVRGMWCYQFYCSGIRNNISVGQAYVRSAVTDMSYCRTSLNRPRPRPYVIINILTQMALWYCTNTLYTTTWFFYVYL